MKETLKQIKLQALKFYKQEIIQWQTKENFTLQQP